MSLLFTGCSCHNSGRLRIRLFIYPYEFPRRCCHDLTVLRYLGLQEVKLRRRSGNPSPDGDRLAACYKMPEPYIQFGSNSMNAVSEHAIRHRSVEKSRCNPAVQHIAISLEDLSAIEHRFHAAIGKTCEAQGESVFVRGTAHNTVCVSK